MLTGKAIRSQKLQGQSNRNSVERDAISKTIFSVLVKWPIAVQSHVTLSRALLVCVAAVPLGDDTRRIHPAASTSSGQRWSLGSTWIMHMGKSIKCTFVWKSSPMEWAGSLCVKGDACASQRKSWILSLALTANTGLPLMHALESNSDRSKTSNLLTSWKIHLLILA